MRPAATRMEPESSIDRNLRGARLRRRETSMIRIAARPARPARGALPAPRERSRQGPRADRHAARDLHRDQSGAGVRRSDDQGGARARRRDRARARQARRRAGHDHRRAGRPGRDRQREERARPTSASWRSIRCAPTQVDFSQTYALAQNTYVVPEASPIKSVADVDRAGVRIGVGARDAGDLLPHPHAEARRAQCATTAASATPTVKMLLAGELEAYARQPHAPA